VDAGTKNKTQGRTPKPCPECRGIYFRTDSHAPISWWPCCAPINAVLRADQLGGEPNPRAAQIVLASIVKIQKVSSYYATTVTREAGRPQVRLAFEDRGDARRLAATVGAEPTNTYPGWATEWTLQLDSATVLALAATLPVPKKKLPPSASGW
jgi:hypothetical protein